MMQTDLAVDSESRGVTVVSIVALRGLGLLLSWDLGVMDEGLTPRGVADGEAERFSTRVGDGALSRLVSTTAGLDSGAEVSDPAGAIVEGGGKLFEFFSADVTALPLVSVFFFSRRTCDCLRA